MKNIMSCAADDAPNMTGKKNGCLKLMQDENPDMLLVHCVIHRQNLVAKNLSPVLNKIMNMIVKCINSIKASAKQERILKLFCEENNEAHVRFLLHTEVKWLSKEKCLKRFMELFDTLSDFLSDKTEMQYLLTIDSKAYLSYLTDIFEKLNILIKNIKEQIKLLSMQKRRFLVLLRLLNYLKKTFTKNNLKSFIGLKNVK